MPSIEELLNEINHYPHGLDGPYMDKMMHSLPDTEVVDRNIFILKHCTDKVVLDIGATGLLHQQLTQVGKKVYSVDRNPSKEENFHQMDFEIDEFPYEMFGDVEIVVCGEVIEHLSNAGNFLKKIAYFSCPKIFTVPNAFGVGAHDLIRKGTECVNEDHVAWYSWKTFSNLLGRYGLQITEFYWYDNPDFIQHQGFNEGMIFVTK